MSRIVRALLAATLVHGALYAASGVFFPGPPPEAPARTDLEVEVLAPRPIPMAAAPAAVSTPTPPRARRAHTIAAPVHVASAADQGPSAAPISVVPAPASPAPTRAERATSIGPTDGARDDGRAEVSATPRYRVNPPPEYPIPSRRRREEGVVMVRVTVDAHGAPAGISLGTSSGHPLLDAAALDAVRRWTFDPARAGGAPVTSLVIVPVRFSLDGS